MGSVGKYGAARPTEVEPTLPPATPNQTYSEAVSTQPAAPEDLEPTLSFSPLVQQAEDCAYGGAFKAIEALDPLTVRFTLCDPDPAFLSKIAFPAFGIVPGAYLDLTGGGGKGSLLLTQPIGTGPYRFTSWLPGEEMIFSSFSDYWSKSKALIPNLVFRWELDDSLRLLQLQTGLVQGIDNPNPLDYSTIQDDPDLVWLSRPPLSTAYAGMNNTYPPFDNQFVRQAITLGLDRQAILEANFPVDYQLANYFTPCVIPNGCVGEAWYGFNPEKARILLADAGYPNGFETQITYRDVVRGYLPHPKIVAEAIQQQLKTNLNITARLIPINSDDFTQAVDEGLLPGLFLLGWGADYPDASNFLDTHFGAQTSKMFGNPYLKIIAPLNQAFMLAEDEARRPHYENANNAILEQVPLIPLVHGAWVFPEGLAAVFNRAITGAHANPLGFERFEEMSVAGAELTTWMQSHEPLSLYCADESDVDTFRACSQVIETLYRFPGEGATPEPALAESCEPNSDLTVWTCQLRADVRFHDQSILNANDVVKSFQVQWDAASPLHKGRSGEFAYFKGFWGEFLNAGTSQ